MPLFTTDTHKIFFAHIPKTGGSSIEDYLIRRFGPMSIRGQHRKGAGLTRQRDVIQSASHLSAADVQAFLPHDLDHSFAVVRDPLKRMISEYRFQLGKSRASSLGFSVWVRTMLACARRDQRVYENHIRPQSDLAPDGAQVFKFEDGFDAVITWLDQVTNSTAPDLDMGHFLKSKRDEIAVTRQDAALVFDFYRQDYERFSYTPPQAQDHPADAFAPLRSVPAHLLAPLIVAGQRRHWMA